MEEERENGKQTKKTGTTVKNLLSSFGLSCWSFVRQKDTLEAPTVRRVEDV